MRRHLFKIACDAMRCSQSLRTYVFSHALPHFSGSEVLNRSVPAFLKSPGGADAVCEVIFAHERVLLADINQLKLQTFRRSAPRDSAQYRGRRRVRRLMTLKFRGYF